MKKSLLTAAGLLILFPVPSSFAALDLGPCTIDYHYVYPIPISTAPGYLNINPGAYSQFYETVTASTGAISSSIFYPLRERDWTKLVFTSPADHPLFPTSDALSECFIPGFIQLYSQIAGYIRFSFDLQEAQLTNNTLFGFGVLHDNLHTYADSPTTFSLSLSPTASPGLFTVNSGSLQTQAQPPPSITVTWPAGHKLQFCGPDWVWQDAPQYVTSPLVITNIQGGTQFFRSIPVTQ